MVLEKSLTWKDVQNQKALSEKIGAIMRDWAVMTRNREQRAFIRASRKRILHLRERYSAADKDFYRLCELLASLPLFLVKDGGGKWLLGQYAAHDKHELARMFSGTRDYEKQEPLFPEILLKIEDFAGFCQKLISGEGRKEI